MAYRESLYLLDRAGLKKGTKSLMPITSFIGINRLWLRH
ncbi:hypothetical protein C3B79_1381 [Aeromonas hydrophila]|nr:hypothetical protein C3B79_1381 [Aeromonas hydrophila]